MTNNDIVTKLANLKKLVAEADSVLKDLSAVSQRLSGTIQKVADLTIEAEKELAWQDALTEVSTAAAAKSGQPASLVFDAFKAAMATNALVSPDEVKQKLFGAPTISDAPPVFVGSNPVSGPVKTAPGQSVKVTGPTHRPNLTDAARLLLSQGKTYQETIDALHQRHPHLAKDNVRRAVGRAFQEKVTRK